MSNEENPARSTDAPLATRWLSRGLECLVADLKLETPAQTPPEPHFDVVVVGSGYGGAVAASEIAARGQDGNAVGVCVLERGRERLAGSFPARFADLAGDVRFSTPSSARARGEAEGLFDVRVGPDLNVLVASGVGGGSLINAGVMELPDDAVFADPAWPAALRGQAAAIQALAVDLRKRLGPATTIADDGAPLPHKVLAMDALANRSTLRQVPITVAISPTPKFRTHAGVLVDRCIGCGDCATGCNHNAKLSLDATLLASAQQAGARIVAGATVLRIARTAGGEPLWELEVVHTDGELRRRQGASYKLRARKVVLAAGTLGSTEILLRSNAGALAFSPRLGERFSSNGDMIAVSHDTTLQVDAVNDEAAVPPPPGNPQRCGPTIASMIDLRASGGGVIQDLSVPGPLRWIFEEVVTTTAALDMLKEGDGRRYPDPASDPCAVDRTAISKSLLVALLGRDSAGGKLRLTRSTGKEAWADGDGGVTVDWPGLRDEPGFAARQDALTRRFQDSGVGGRVLPNPMWKLLPDELDFLFSGTKGPLLTVHPLGGCAMADDVARGVVDDRGRVFDAGPGATAGALHDGLVVLDGAIIPTSLGINPSLTIASVATRAVRLLCEDWEYTDRRIEREDRERPVFQAAPAPVPAAPTEIEIVERLSGFADVSGIAVKGVSTPRVWVELTMRFDPLPVRKLVAAQGGAVLNLLPEQGRLRIFATRPLQDREAVDSAALLIAPVSGTLSVFQHEASTPLARRLRGLWAWFRNRGLRDTWQSVADWLQGTSAATGSSGGVLASIWNRIKGAWNLASRAADRRLLAYDLTLGSLAALGTDVTLRDADFAGQRIAGRKTLTYSRRSNPWRQLMRVPLDAFPNLTGAAALELDTGFLARQGLPLMRLVGQQDQPTALAEIGSLLLFLTRMLLHVHAWSFRAPDAPEGREPQRLPGDIRGLPAHRPSCFPVAERDGKPVMVRLTNYRGRNADLPGGASGSKLPVVLFHGYSVSGTTFTHPAVKPNFAQFLWEQGRDVWVVDLRTSSGMPFATSPWTFEEVAAADIPMAIHQVLLMTGAPKVDVFAHCMGSAMLSMALLDPQPLPTCWPRPQLLSSFINSLATSQVPPAVIMTPANVFRAYMMRTLKRYLPITDYQFRAKQPASLQDQLIDRLLATLPYPESEFDIENPFLTPWKRTPWVGTRHRMDALYGRDFNVGNLPDEVLSAIDDLFGPLNIDTVSQAIHFAADRTITDSKGFNRYTIPGTLRDVFGNIPLLSAHGADNGLADVQSVAHWETTLTDCDTRFSDARAFDKRIYEGYGHQDCLVGVKAGRTFGDIVAFFDRNAPVAPLPKPPETKPLPDEALTRFSAVVPSFGVRPSRQPHEYSLGDSSGRGFPLGAFCAPVRKLDGVYVIVDASGRPEPDRTKWLELVRIATAERLWDGDESRVSIQLDEATDRTPDGADGVLVLMLYNQSSEIGAVYPAHGRPVYSLEEFAALLGERRQLAPLPVVLPPGWLLAGLSGDLLRAMQALIDKALAPVVLELARSLFHAFANTGAATMATSLLRGAAVARSQSSGSATFAVASCQYPGGMLDRTAPGTPVDARAGPADASWQWLARLIADGGDVPGGRPLPTELLLLGDQIYADATAGLFDPRVTDDPVRLAYQAFLGARGPRVVLSGLPATMRFDDHEIVDNWEPDPPGAKARLGDVNTGGLLHGGLVGYEQQQCDKDASKNPPIEAHATWTSVDNAGAPRLLAGAPAFLADARSRRTPRTVGTIATASILGDDQFDALAQWLQDTPPGVAFVTTASMVLPRRRVVADSSRAAGSPCVATALRSDAWDGYPASLRRLLGLVHRRGDGLVFLSGDEHLSNFTTFTVTRRHGGSSATAHSIHASALYAPWPFANSQQADFAGSEVFTFTSDVYGADEEFECAVGTAWPQPGDGFALVTVEQVVAAGADGPGTRVAVRFDGPTRLDPVRNHHEFTWSVTPSTDAPLSSLSASEGVT